jgi:nucleoside-diphosphate-sugar epimerase
VYGAQDGLIDESSPLAPVSLYAQSKIDAEHAILEKTSDGFHPTVLRLATAYGLSHRMRFDLVVNLLTARALTKGNITIFNGHQWRPFIHVDDISRAFIACLEAPVELVGRQTFNAGDNASNLTLKELGDLVARLVPGTKVTHQENSTDRRSYRVDFSRIAGQLGFRCKTTVEDGVEAMAAAVKDGTFGECDDIAYNNAAHLKAADGKLPIAMPSYAAPQPARVNGTNGHGAERKTLVTAP